MPIIATTAIALFVVGATMSTSSPRHLSATQPLSATNGQPQAVASVTPRGKSAVYIALIVMENKATET